jgi:hypothetical protein
MFSRLVVVAGVVGALALPVQAAAKVVTKITICGKRGCHSTDDRDRLAALPVGGTPTEPPTAAPFYRVTVRIRAERPVSFGMYYLPRPGLLREYPVHGSWMRVQPAQAGALAALARGLTPFPATRLPYHRLPVPNAAPVPIATSHGQQAASSGGGFPWAVFLAVALGLAGGAFAVRLRVRQRGPAAQ